MMPTLGGAGEQLARGMTAFLARPGVLGALVISRDGLPVRHAGAMMGDLDTFAAMQATALGAAEIALRGMDGQAKMGLMLDLGQRRYLSRAITEGLLLVALVDGSCRWEQAFAWMEDVGRAVG